MEELKTNYVDDVLYSSKNQLRKYQQIQNDDGTVSFVDVTEYSTTGTSFGAKDINDTNAAVNELNESLTNKQDKSDAITTSNISSQSVKYANNAMYASYAERTSHLGSYSEDINSESSATHVLVNDNGKIQHRVIPTNLVLKGNGWMGFTKGTYLDFGYDDNLNGFLIDVVFADGSKFRILFSSGSGNQVHFQRMSPQGVWETYRSI